MNETTHEVQIVATSVEEIKQLLGLAEELKKGSEIRPADGLTLRVTDMSKSSGFDVTTIIITFVVPVVTSTTSALLIEWLKSRFFKGGAKTGATASVDGKELKPRGDGLR